MIFDVEVNGTIQRLQLERTATGYTVTMDGRTLAADVCEPMPGVVSVLIGEDGNGGRAYRAVPLIAAEERFIAMRGDPHRVSVADPRSLRGQHKRAGGANGKLQMKAVMPGRVARVLVEAGLEVAAHEAVLVVEAMKMQNELKVTRAGRVTEVRVSAGDTVAAGQVMLVIE